MKTSWWLFLFLVFAVNLSVGFIEIEYPKSGLVDNRFVIVTSSLLSVELWDKL